MKTTKLEWIRTTIKEPFPLFFAHTNYPSEHRRETATGPCYAENSEFWARPEFAAHCESRAESLRARGWTVTVERVVR